MQRSRGFRPSRPDPLEGRVVPSQVYFSPQTGIIAGTSPAHAAVTQAHHAGEMHSTARIRSVDGKPATVATTVGPDGAGGVRTTTIIREPDGTREVVDEAATATAGAAAGTRSFARAITLPDGTRQAETGTDATAGSTATLAADGTVQPHPTSAAIRSRTTTFSHVLTQPGLGVETIAGTATTQAVGGRLITVTDEQVVGFDGSHAAVRQVAIEQGGLTTIQRATILADGAVTTSVGSDRVLFLT